MVEDKEEKKQSPGWGRDGEDKRGLGNSENEMGSFKGSV